MKLSGGRRFERWIFDRFLHPERGEARGARPRSGLTAGILERCQATPALFQRFRNYLQEDYLRSSDPEAHQQDGVRVISAGPNAFLYVLDVKTPLDFDAVEQRFPGLAEQLSLSPGVGFVLARSAGGPLCFRQGKRHQLRESEPGPFAQRADAALVVQGIADLMGMPSAGDLVIYGIDAPEGHVSFIPEVGAHAGPSPDELHTVILHPAQVTLPAPIIHPVQLYEHFIRYQERSPGDAPRTAPQQDRRR